MRVDLPCVRARTLAHVCGPAWARGWVYGHVPASVRPSVPPSVRPLVRPSARGGREATVGAVGPVGGPWVARGGPWVAAGFPWGSREVPVRPPDRPTFKKLKTS